MYHLHVKFINKHSNRTAAGVLEYIARLGAFHSKGDSLRELIVSGMPGWVRRTDGLDYWQCADSTNNRANALIAFTVEFAIPRVLSVPHQRELVMLMINAVSDLSGGDRTKYGSMPLCAAIHEGYGRNPHVHLLISTSIPDGLHRSPQVWFRRYKAQLPQAGGARRSRTMGSKRWLLSLRQAWAKVANAYLLARGHSLQIDHRSHKARGIRAAPGIHLGPSATHLKRIGKPSPRVQRYSVLEADRLAQERLDADIAALTKARQELAEAKDRDDRDHAMLTRQMMNDVDIYVSGHPFASSAKRILSNMAWMVTDQSDASAAQRGELSLALLAQEAGEAWLMRPHRTGVYFAKPGLTGLVMVSQGCVVSDSGAVDALNLGLRLSMGLKFIKPMLAAKQAVIERCRVALDQLQLAWPLHIHTPNELRAEATHNSPRLHK